ncbi:hypothetical protein B0H16DRAFT_1297858 [Mycena metata]|uniref:Uncharacterized protein n=1 Tax=Mycena metata TaxID=1033252 RepID=A0AAD7KDZ0_9AGAR|nr:hypothetical protein B0H16DRAFT_1297858 [Mycena metata]
MYLKDLPTSVSGRKVCDSLADSKVFRSARDFRVQGAEKYTSHVAEACASLRTKKILLVGPETTYYLHSLWLNALEAHEHRIHECPGPEFCNFHHICLPANYTAPQDRYKFAPKDGELVNSALLRYVLSTSLYASKDKNDTAYTEAVVDPLTGIRLKNAFWLLHARKADVILLNRGPIPAPAWTFAGHKTQGNWTFARELPRHLGEGDSLRTEIINAAFHATVTRFIPELLESLRAIYKDPWIRHKTLAWHASWSIEADFVDPWALYYNAQVYMQNYLLRTLLPGHGVHFLSRMIPSGLALEDLPTKSSPQDRLRFPLGKPNAHAMEAVFLKSLIELLECVG